MKSIQKALALSVFGLGLALAACNSAGLEPAPGAGGGPTAAIPAFQNLGIALPDSGLPLCSVPAATLPNTYTSILGAGEVRRGALAGNSTHTLWAQAQLTSASPPPSASPGATPSVLPSLPPVKVYLYYGTYTLRIEHQTGCAYIAVTESLRPIPGTHLNAAIVGVPNLSKWFSVSKVLNKGYASTSVAHLSASGGSGTITLYTLSGSTFDSGTISLTGRTLIAP